MEIVYSIVSIIGEILRGDREIYITGGRWRVFYQKFIKKGRYFMDEGAKFLKGISRRALKWA